MVPLPILIFLLLLLLTFLSVLGISWYFSSRLLSRTSNSTPSILVTDLDATSITLQRTKNTQRSGVFGITGPNGQAIVGPVLSSTDSIVTRKLIAEVGEISSNEKVSWNTTVFGGVLRDSLKLTINEVSIPGPLGYMPAWFVPGKSEQWAILVHGATGTREQGLRVFQPLAETGLGILDMTYRNDKGAPASPDRLSHLGDSEWQDLEAAIKYALAQGAQNILLYGWSMGGTIVLTFLARSPYANKVQAVVLDSPVLSWRTTLAALTKKNRLPSFIARVTEMIVSARIRVNFAALEQQNQLKSLPHLLIFQGIGDTTAPIEVSDAFTSTRSHIRYCRISNAEHTQCWNRNPKQYEEELRLFLKDVLAPGQQETRGERLESIDL